MSNSEKIICLGKEFNSEDERREYFRKELREKLPELKKMEGFPIGEDDDIIALSDPPYFTACPNPWLNDFIHQWEKEKATIPGRKNDFHVAEPYASDVSEGKNNPIYMAHSYHTKVPHPAIMRYILHYTQPGDIIYDGFAGTGMTGVASNFCEFPTANDKYRIEKEFKKNKNTAPIWGMRKTILGDLSSVASFIAYNYNIPINALDFKENSKLLIDKLKEKFNWLYDTIHKDNKKGIINYIIWSDVYICSNCNSEIIFWESAIDKDDNIIRKKFKCKKCNTEHTKRTVSDALITEYNPYTEKSVTHKKRIPVLITYTFN